MKTVIVKSFNELKEFIATLKEHETMKAAIVKKKNKAFAKYL